MPWLLKRLHKEKKNNFKYCTPVDGRRGSFNERLFVFVNKTDFVSSHRQKVNQSFNYNLKSLRDCRHTMLS